MGCVLGGAECYRAGVLRRVVLAVKFGELFAGIGGFGLAAHRAGQEVAWASEIDDFATRVYAARFPNVRQLGDVTKIEPEPVDCITAGFPCQDLSVAGKRKGLVGERSGLFWEIIRVARGIRPRWLVLENVPGLLSSHRGRDFGTVLTALDELGYGVAWRVLDAQFFGVPQRRRRVFIVGHFGGPCPAEVLFEPESLSGNLEARREAGAGVTRDVAACLNSGGNDGGFRTEPGEHLVAMPLLAKGNSSHAEDLETYIARPITATSYKGHDEDTDTIVTHALRSEGADASEDGTGRGTPIVAQPIRSNRWGGADSHGDEGNTVLAPMLRVGGREQAAGSSSDNTPVVAAPITASYGKQLDSSDTASGPPNLLVQIAPRRLTPRECERLQGFPDDWTLIDGASDSARYRALGNAVAVPVVEWIIKRLAVA